MTTTIVASDNSIWRLIYYPPPIPTRACDYQIEHEDYDGPEDDRAFFGSSERDCMEKVEEWILDQEE